MGGPNKQRNACENRSRLGFSPAEEGKTWFIPYYVRGLALGIPIYFVAIHFWAWILIAPHFYKRNDFRQFYSAAYMMRTGHVHELYDFDAQKTFEDRLVSPESLQRELPFVSPAYDAALFVPFTYLGFQAAYILFVGINIGLLGLCLYLLRFHIGNLTAIYRWLPFAIVLGFYPIGWTLILGQDSILLTADLVVAYCLLQRDRATAAGSVMALALFKFQIILPIALLFLLWKRFRLVKGFAVGALALGAISIWLTGIPQARLYVQSLLSIASLKPSTAGMAQHAVLWQMMPNVNGIIVALLGGIFSTLWLRTISAFLSVLIIVGTARLGRYLHSAGALLLLSIPAAILVGYHTYIHDLCPLLLPLLVLLDKFLPYEGTGSRREMVVGRTAVLMFVAPVINSFFPNHTFLVSLPIAGLLLALAGSGSTRISGCTVMQHSST